MKKEEEYQLITFSTNEWKPGSCYYTRRFLPNDTVASKGIVICNVNTIIPKRLLLGEINELEIRHFNIKIGNNPDFNFTVFYKEIIL